MMIGNIAAWNIRGAHCNVKQKELKNLIKEHNLNMIAMLESKLNADVTKKACTFIKPY